jgi:hypothetical protein
VVLLWESSSLNSRDENLSCKGGVLAREIEASGADYTQAFDQYEKTIRNWVEASQNLAFIKEFLITAIDGKKYLTELYRFCLLLMRF